MLFRARSRKLHLERDAIRRARAEHRGPAVGCEKRETLRAASASSRREREKDGESSFLRRDSPTSDFTPSRSTRLDSADSENEAHRQSLGLLRRAGRGLRRGAFPAGTPPGEREAHGGAGKRVGVEELGERREGREKKANKIQKKRSNWVSSTSSERSLGDHPHPAFSPVHARLPDRQQHPPAKKKKQSNSSPRSFSSASRSTPSRRSSSASLRSGTCPRPTRVCRATSPRRARTWRGAAWWTSWRAIERESCVKR